MNYGALFNIFLLGPALVWSARKTSGPDVVKLAFFLSAVVVIFSGLDSLYLDRTAIQQT